MANIEANRQLEERTLLFAVAVVRFVASFPRSDSAAVIGRQLYKAGTSIGANYREANRAESKDDFVHKTAVVVKESSEADYWLELRVRTDLENPVQRAPIAQEGRELLTTFNTINRRAKGS